MPAIEASLRKDVEFRPLSWILAIGFAWFLFDLIFAPTFILTLMADATWWVGSGPGWLPARDMRGCWAAVPASRARRSGLCARP
jgi:hypothetical protein